MEKPAMMEVSVAVEHVAGGVAVQRQVFHVTQVRRIVVQGKVVPTRESAHKAQNYKEASVERQV
jgi:hypothetical protein